MNRRKRMYPRRNKINIGEVIVSLVMIVGMVFAGKYVYNNFENINIKSFLSKQINSITARIDALKDEPQYITADDISEELENLDEEVINLEEDDVKLASINGWSFYTIQVAAISDDEELKQVESILNTNKIANSTVEVDGTKKVQTYAYFDEATTRGFLEEIRIIYPDAFVSETKIPMLSIEYTNKYDYVGEISQNLNELIKSFEEESIFWENNNVNVQEYNKILTSRSEIITKIETEAKKIDYEGMENFKEGLIKYVNGINEEITNSSKAYNEENYYISKSSFISCMQGYFSFINLIQG
jgi:hypothetical protein